MKVRLMGTAAECAVFVELLRDLDDVEILEVSGGYSNRGDSQLQRVYVEVEVGGYVIVPGGPVRPPYQLPGTGVAR